MSLRELWQRDRAATAARTAAIGQILAETRFRAGIDALAAEQKVDAAQLLSKASHYLDEMMTTHDEAIPDFSLILCRLFDRDGFEKVLHYDEATLDRLKPLDGQQTLVITTAHRSYTDFLVRVPFALKGFAREYRFAGANLRFWPMGPIAHRLGLSFVRRGQRDPLYAYVLRQFVGYMTEQRANFMWALEGGRTRTGKLLRPKVGLLAYVADAFVDDRSAGVLLVPTTIVYEYLDEVFEYASYGRGAQKQGESSLKMFKKPLEQRRVPREAGVYVGVGEPVSLGDHLERDGGRDAEKFSAGIMRAAIEVCRRVDAATPITAVALVLLPLLERDGVSLTAAEVLQRLAPVHAYIARRELPAPGVAARDEDDVRRALELLRGQGLLTTTPATHGTRYAVTPGRHLECAFYRNSLVHHLLIPSVVELGVVRAGEAEPADRADAVLREADRLRDLLEYEFFFPEADDFRSAVLAELAARDADWATTIAGEGGADALLDRFGAPFAPQAIGSFLDAHWAVANRLNHLGEHPLDDQRGFRLDCLAHAELDLHTGRLSRPDAASVNLYDNPLEWAKRHGLLGADAAAGRDAFADGIEAFVRALAVLEQRSTQAADVGLAGA